MIDTTELRKLIEAGSDLPWDWNFGILFQDDDSDDSRIAVFHDEYETPFANQKANCALITAALNSLPSLLDEIEELQKKNAVMSAIIQQAFDDTVEEVGEG